ncbi:MAG TPA: trehalose-6-phosphate synthase [Candidatus Bathyarchaeia archaeon]|nr:trehalose-6-phosphate synthase [Candidatus Bathyarchaeia archaeon]
MSLIVVSNRLPVVARRQAAGGVSLENGTGGLVTALRPVLQHRGGTWVGWAGESTPDQEATRRLLEGMERTEGYELVPVALPEDERRGFYEAFSNEAIWPLFHDLATLARFRTDAWTLAQRVNRRFAAKVLERVKPDDLVWVHDYHLIGAARAMKEGGFAGRLAFFLHIPFPPLDLFLKLPWRSEVLQALLAYDLVGVQTMRDRANLLQCVRHLVPDAEIHGKGATASVVIDGRPVRVGAYPIGIDFDEFAGGARAPGVVRKAESIRKDEADRTILLSVDRLDYTKGLTHRLDAFSLLLEKEPDLRGNVTLVQFVIPSRGGIAQYTELKREIERRVGELNGRFTRSGWVPVHHNYRAIPREKLLAYYRAADIALVTPLKDGMNLVCKEYCASRVDGDGVLVLSEFAGAAAQLSLGALLVNPWDAAGFAAAISRAVRMSEDERRARMRKLRRAVREHDVASWADAFLRAAYSREEQEERVEELHGLPAD